MLKEIKDENGKITTKTIGYVPELIEHLRQKMKFIPKIIWLPSNHSYNLLVDEVANNIYDMVVGDVTIIAARREKVGFSTAIFDNSLRIIVRTAATNNIDLFAYLRPFSLNLRLVILSALVWYAILIYLFEGRYNTELQGRSMIYRIGMSMRYATETILGQNPNFHLKTAAGRLLTVGLYILSVVLIAAYNASLTSSLTISKYHEIISGLDDIKNGRLPFNRIGIVTNSSIEDFFLREVSISSRNFYPLRSKKEIYSMLLNNIIDAAIMDAGVLEYMVNSIYCNLTLLDTRFDYSSFGIVFPKNWIYKQKLDVSILSLRELGIFDNLKTKWFQSSYCSNSYELSNELSISSMAGLFCLFGIISIISILLFCARSVRSYVGDYLTKSVELIFRLKSDPKPEPPIYLGRF